MNHNCTLMDSYENQVTPGRVFCPKPRRVVHFDLSNQTAHPVPLRSQRDNEVESFDLEIGTELLDLIRRKDDIEGDLCGKVAPSSPFFFGSPPCRVQNPMVHDAHFGVEKPIPICPLSFGTTLPSPAPPKASFGTMQATVRVEGFECPSPRFIAMV